MIRNEINLRIYLRGLLANIDVSIKKDGFLPIDLEDNNPLYQMQLIDAARCLAAGVSNLQRQKTPYLQSIFNSLDQEKTQAVYLPLEVMQMTKAIFPKTTTRGEGAEEQAKIWQAFEKEVKNLSDLSLSGAYVDTLLHLLYKYTTNIPCGYQGMEDVSHYDLAKLTAGIALCLHRWEEGRENSPGVSFDLQGTDEPLLLISGDLSGIQDYIYDIISKYASKNLKGRSFYLQMLSTSVLFSLLDALDLYQGNVIYDSGGSFYLVAPNTEEMKLKLEKFVSHLTEELFRQHKTSLFLALDWVALNQADLLEGQLQQKMKKLAGQLDDIKQQKFKTKIESDYDAFFGKEVEKGSGQIRDITTGEAIDEQVEDIFEFSKDTGRFNKVSNKSIGIEQHFVSDLTAQQIILGQELKKLEYWILSPESLAKLDTSLQKVEIQPCGTGLYNYFISAQQYEKLNNRFPSSGLRIFRINNLDPISQFIIDKGQHSYGYLFYGGDDYPTDIKDKPMTFSEMAGALESEKEKTYGEEYKKKEINFKRLGILRMDVDDLGYFFRNGIPANRLSLTRYTTLSRQLDFFFKGYLNHLWQEETEIKARSQIIYSGGDDLFIVGKWDLMIRLAEKIKTAFNEWVCSNPQLGISGGLSIVTHKFPIMKAADMAGAMEKRAKKHALPKEYSGSSHFEKKSLTLLGCPLHWESTSTTTTEGKQNWANEFEEVRLVKEQLLSFIRNENQKQKLAKSILQKIMMLENMYQHHLLTGENPKWAWTTAYYFSKLADQYQRRGGSQVATFLKDLSKQILLQGNRKDSTYHRLELLAIAARWASLENRQLES